MLFRSGQGLMALKLLIGFGFRWRRKVWVREPERGREQVRKKEKKREKRETGETENTREREKRYLFNDVAVFYWLA